MSVLINLVFEDDLSEFVLTKLLNSFGDKYTICNGYNGNGFGYIKSNLNGFNEAAKGITFLVLTDLDNYECPIELINDWFANRSIHPNLIFRIAVREVEAWLLADMEGFSNFTGVSQASFPLEPEKEADPKQTLINICRRSRKRNVKDDIVPINNNAAIGPNYNGRLLEYVFGDWDIERAKQRSESLQRAYQKLENFVPHNS